MASRVSVQLPENVVEAIDRQIASGRYETRDELVRHAVEGFLEHAEHIDPAEDWAGDAGMHFLGEAAKRWPYEGGDTEPTT